MMMQDRRFATFLRDRIGLDAGSIGLEGVQRAVKLRATEIAGGDLDRYWHALMASAEEREALVEAVVVPETWFFRYPESIEFLVSRVGELVARLGGDRVIRIITLPCSSGEEPYTLAMALLDAGFTPSQFSIVGLDVSVSVIDKAKRARYGKNSFRGESLLFQHRHFTLHGTEYVLSDTVKACVTFRCENLFDLSAETLVLPFDIVFCRNLLIYFDLETQTRALTVLTRLCRAEGDLFVGPAEASLLTRTGYKPRGSYRAFAFGATRVAAATTSTTSPARSEPKPMLDRAFQAATWPRSADAPSASERKAAVFKPAMPAPPLPSTAPQVTDVLKAIQDLADRGRLEEALALAADSIASGPANAELFYLMGLCLDAKGEGVQASIQYRKALYLDPAHIQALTHLAAILDANGDSAGAQRMRLRATREEARNV